MAKMKDMAVKRDELRKSFIGDPTLAKAEGGGAPGEVDELSCYL